MKILDKIIARKKSEIALNKEIKPVKLLERSIYFETPVVSMKKYLQRKDKVGIIAEIKRSSPSTGLLKHQLDVEKLSIAYMQAGATALSVLTDEPFFKGSNEDLMTARKFNYCPILRKDFIIDEYQLVEAKSIGADCILLIAACLSPTECRSLADIAGKLGLEVLLEVHSEKEIHSYVHDRVNIVGINNRNLQDFTTRIETSLQLISSVPEEFIKISESGISNSDQLIKLKDAGFDGFLIGGYFMKQPHPAEACRQFIHGVQKQTV